MGLEAHLTFVGIGPRGAKGLSRAAFEAVASAGEAFVEAYTALLPEEALVELERTRGRPVVRLSREEVEDGRAVLEAASRPGGAVLLVAGDPMAATTHVSLRLEAARRGVPTHLVFAPSIVHTAFSEVGLQHYKAGRTVTIPFPEKSYGPTSPFEKIAANLRAGLHTLVLLDVRAHEGRYMTAREALRELIEVGKPLPEAGIGEHTLVAVVARAGEPDCRRAAGAARRLADLDFGPPMHCLIVPGRLHFEEREALKVLCGAREDELPAP